MNDVSYRHVKNFTFQRPCKTKRRTQSAYQNTLQMHHGCKVKPGTLENAQSKAGCIVITGHIHYNIELNVCACAPFPLIFSYLFQHTDLFWDWVSINSSA